MKITIKIYQNQCHENVKKENILRCASRKYNMEKLVEEDIRALNVNKAVKPLFKPALYLDVKLDFISTV